MADCVSSANMIVVSNIVLGVNLYLIWISLYLKFIHQSNLLNLTRNPNNTASISSFQLPNVIGINLDVVPSCVYKEH